MTSAQGEYYPRPLVRTPFSLLLMHNARHAGISWFVEKDHWIVASLGAGIGMWGFLQAFATGHADRFSRSGSIIVVFALLSIFVGLRHSKTLFERKQEIDKAQAMIDQVRTSEHAQWLSTIWLFAITAIGTLIWGYGDIC